MDILHKPTKILVTGRSGSGKTSFLQYHLLQESKHDKVFVFDPEGEFHKRLGVSPVYALGEIARHKGRFFCYDTEKEPSPNAFDDFCLFCFEYAKVANQSILMVVDELQTYVNAYYLSNEFMDCVLRGRRYRLDLLLSSQQANLIHNAVRSHVSEIVCFGQADVNAVKFAERFGVLNCHALADLEFIRKRVGADGEQAGRIVFLKKGVDIVYHSSKLTS